MRGDCIWKLDVRDERKRITWRVGGVLNPSWLRPWVHSNTDTHARIHTLAHTALKHTDTGEAKRKLLGNNNKGKEKNYVWRGRGEKTKAIKKKQKQGRRKR